jgi:hypothetical protein
MKYLSEGYSRGKIPNFLGEPLAKKLHQNNKILEGDTTVTTMATEKEKKTGMTCQRCGGRMIFEKFYDVNNVFFAWHCVICGEILDAVILLHRLSQDADLRIPEEEQEVMHLLKKYLHAKPKELQGGRKDKRGELEHPLKVKSSMN